MPDTIFTTTTLSQPSFFQRLFKQYPDENAVKAINNLLATKALLQITRQDIDEVVCQYKVNVQQVYNLNLQEFYAVYLNECLTDRILSDDELKELQHLKNILGLDDKTVDKLHVMVGEIIYKKSFEEAVADGRLTPEENTFLEKLQTTLRLPATLAAKISQETRSNFMQTYVAKIIADQRLSPDDEKEMAAIASSLQIKPITDDTDQATLDKLKRYWALENLELPTIEPNIALQKNEHCHMKMDGVQWYELRRVRQKVSYSGYSASFKVAKGFYLRSGSYSPRTYSTDEMTLIDTGTLYLTNKRIVFTGHSKNSNIRLEKILQIIPDADGVEIGKETGKSPVLKLPERPDVFCIVLERLMGEQRH
jgi:hypothetical protein